VFSPPFFKGISGLLTRFDQNESKQLAGATTPDEATEKQQQDSCRQRAYSELYAELVPSGGAAPLRRQPHEYESESAPRFSMAVARASLQQLLPSSWRDAQRRAMAMVARAQASMTSVRGQTLSLGRQTVAELGRRISSGKAGSSGALTPANFLVGESRSPKVGRFQRRGFWFPRRHKRRTRFARSTCAHMMRPAQWLWARIDLGLRCVSRVGSRVFQHHHTSQNFLSASVLFDFYFTTLFTL
jgi:hypothetical protein